MSKQWASKDTKSLGVYSICAKCRHNNKRFQRKKQIKVGNKKDEKAYEKAKKDHKDKFARGENSSAQSWKQQSLQMVYWCI